MDIITRIGPGFKYRFRDTLRGVVAFTAVVVGVILLSIVLAATESGVSSVYAAGYELAMMITLFVYGICTIREDLRLANQCGRGRVSAYVVNLLSLCTCAAIMAVAGEILMTLAQLITVNMAGVEITTMYQMLIEDTGGADKAAIVRHLESIVLSFSVSLAATYAGVFLSALFYRLNKLWTTVAAIALAACVLYVVPMILLRLYEMSEAFRCFLQFIVEDEMHLAVAMLVCAAIVCAVNLLLVRRAPIRAAGER